MAWLVLLVVFGAGFGLGAWRAGRPERSLVRASCDLPLVLIVGTAGLAGFLLYAAQAGDSFAGLAAASVTLIGGVLALLSFAGGLFGAWFRRAGDRS